MEKQENEIIQNLKKYFNAEIIGSYLLYEIGLLKYNEINDIDVQIPKESLKNAYQYLNDIGYKQTEKQGKQIGYEHGKCIFEILPQGDFKQTNFLNIDVVEKTQSQFTIPTLIAEKFKRAKNSDFKQIAIIASRKIDVDFMKLQHHKDTTIGLYAIDRNPTEVDYDWILKNNFQIQE